MITTEPKVTLDDYLGKHKLEYDIQSVVLHNAEYTVQKVNRLLAYLESYGVALHKTSQGSYLTSGWRPAEYNLKVPGASPRSKHITGCAADIYDPEGEIDDWLMDNQWLLKELGLHMEHPSATKSWCHIQTVPPKSNKLVFYP